MSSAASNEAYGNQAWGAQAPWGSSRGNQGWGDQGWGNQAWANQNGPAGQGRWAGPPFWYPVGISRPMAVLFTVLGFLFWWPVGLAILIYMLATGRVGRRGFRRWQMSQGNGGGGGSWADGPCAWGPAVRNWFGGSPVNQSSGNHAFDEYKAETLRRLEEEQKEFAAFLDRLRFAKDKAEFDQFMAERRQRPPAQPQDPQGQG